MTMKNSLERALERAHVVAFGLSCFKFFASLPKAQRLSLRGMLRVYSRDANKAVARYLTRLGARVTEWEDDDGCRFVQLEMAQ